MRRPLPTNEDQMTNKYKGPGFKKLRFKSDKDSVNNSRKSETPMICMSPIKGALLDAASPFNSLNVIKER